MTVLQHWGGHWQVQGQEGEGLSEERKARRGEGAAIWPRWWQVTWGAGWTMREPYAPTGATSDDESIDLGNLYQYFSGQGDGNQENLSSLPWNFSMIE